jgi:hypothetical protein
MDLNEVIVNIFCPTGQGGGIKPDCGRKVLAAKSPAIKIGNTSRKVLEEAMQSGRGQVSITSAIGRKAFTGGKVHSLNSRRMGAAAKLEKAGNLTKSAGTTERETGRGMTASYSTVTYQITEKGRQIVAPSAPPV